MSNSVLDLHRAVEPRLDFLDSCRGAAVLAVFTYHCLDPVFSDNAVSWGGNFRSCSFAPENLLFVAASFGVYGVAVFFAVSGFCIQLSVARQASVDWGKFFLRRGFRILPTYWFWLSVFALFSILAAMGSGQPCIGFKNIFAHTLLVQNLREEIVYSINPSFWSLAIEWQLYMLFPLVLIGVRLVGWLPILAVTATLEIIFRNWAGTESGLFRPSVFTPFNYWWAWTIGAFVADRFSTRDSLPLSRIPLALCVLTTVFAWFWKPTSLFVFPAVSFTTAVWLSKRLTSHSSARVANWKSNAQSYRPLARLGVCSYSFYLIHQPVLMSVGRIMDQCYAFGNAAKIVILYSLVIPIYLISVGSFRWLETPSNRYGKAMTTKGKGASGIAGG